MTASENHQHCGSVVVGDSPDDPFRDSLNLKLFVSDNLALDCIMDEFLDCNTLEYEIFPQPEENNFNILYQESKHYNPFAKEESNVV